MILEKFIDEIDKDLSWRKKEIIDLWNFISYISKTNSRSYNYRKIHYRSFILLLYAHIEGFLKKGGSLYLKNLNDQNKKFSEFTDNFFEIYFDRQYKGGKKYKDIMFDYNNRAYFYYKRKEIQTKSNLNLKQLKIVLSQFGFDFEDFSEKFRILLKEKLETGSFINLDLLNLFVDLDGNNYNFSNKSEILNIKRVIDNIDIEESYIYIIDNSLLEKRNGIAHGEQRDLELEYLENLRHIIILLLDSFRELFMGYYIGKKYLK